MIFDKRAKNWDLICNLKEPINRIINKLKTNKSVLIMFLTEFFDSIAKGYNNLF